MGRPSPFTIIRQRPMKSSLILGIPSAALYFYYDYAMTDEVMRMSCRRATAYGDQLLQKPGTPTRHITVILNPVAGKRKSKKLYTKWVEPLLHLAGIKVSLIETESTNQTYDLMKIMSNCDGVAIVGGDGTVHEALNGLLSRPDCVRAARNFPIGIIPTGQYNSIARYIHQNHVQYRNQKEFLINATMRLVDSSTDKFDVLKISPTDERLKTSERPVFALRDIRYGIYQDYFIKTNGVKLYQTYVRPLWLQFQRFLGRNKNPIPQLESLTYTRPCEGCTKCFDRHKLKEAARPVKAEEQPGVNKRWWGLVAPIASKKTEPTAEELRQLELSKRDNPECGQWISIASSSTSDITDFRACMMGDKCVRLSLARQNEFTASDVTEVQDVKLKVAAALDNEKLLSSQGQAEQKEEASNDKENKKAEEKEGGKNQPNFLIDGQPNQAHSVEITAIEKAVTVFTGPPKIIM